MNIKIRAAMLAGMALPLMSGMVMAASPIGTGFEMKAFVTGTGNAATFIGNNVVDPVTGASKGNCAVVGTKCSTLAADINQGFLQQRVDVTTASGIKSYIRTIVLDAPTTNTATKYERFADESFVVFGGGGNAFTGHNYIADVDESVATNKKYFRTESNLAMGELGKSEARTQLAQWTSDDILGTGGVSAQLLSACSTTSFCGKFTYASVANDASGVAVVGNAAMELHQNVLDKAPGTAALPKDLFSEVFNLVAQIDPLAPAATATKSQKIDFLQVLDIKAQDATGTVSDGKLIFGHASVMDGVTHTQALTGAIDNITGLPPLVASATAAAGEKLSNSWIGSSIANASAASTLPQVFGAQVVTASNFTTGAITSGPARAVGGEAFKDIDLGGTGKTTWGWDAALFGAAPPSIP